MILLGRPPGTSGGYKGLSTRGLAEQATHTARGTPVNPACSVVSYNPLHTFFRAWGPRAGWSPAFRAPSDYPREGMQPSLGGKSPREIANGCLKFESGNWAPVARIEPTGRRKAPPDDRLREIRVAITTGDTAPDFAALHPGYELRSCALGFQTVVVPANAGTHNNGTRGSCRSGATRVLPIPHDTYGSRVSFVQLTRPGTTDVSVRTAERKERNLAYRASFVHSPSSSFLRSSSSSE
jgi:hypothetical protein